MNGSNHHHQQSGLWHAFPTRLIWIVPSVLLTVLRGHQDELVGQPFVLVIGKAKEKVLPFPTSLSSQILPP